MKELTKVFGETPLEIKVIDDENFYVDITGVAKRFRKNITHWKSSKRFKEYLSALQKRNGLKDNLIVDDVVGQTLIHNKLLIPFARFISADFEVWCDNLVYEVMTNQYKEDLERNMFEFKGQVIATLDMIAPDKDKYGQKNKNGAPKIKLVKSYFKADNSETNKKILDVIHLRDEMKKGTLFPDIYEKEINRLENEIKEELEG